MVESLAFKHLDLRLRPPRGSCLDRPGAPFLKISPHDLQTIEDVVEKMRPVSREPISDSEFLEAFIEHTTSSLSDTWQTDSRFINGRKGSVSAISTAIKIRLEDTRIYGAYEHRLPSTASGPSVPFDAPGIALSASWRDAMLYYLIEGIIDIQRGDSFARKRVHTSVDFPECFHRSVALSLTEEERKDIHIRFSCPWRIVVTSGEPDCRCQPFSAAEPGRYLVRSPRDCADWKPRHLPLIVHGLEGSQRLFKAFKKIAPELLERQNADADLHKWRSSVRRSKALTTRQTIARCLVRLMAAYELGGSVFGAAMIGTRFMRFFVLGPSRVAVEILPSSRDNIDDIPPLLPWTLSEHVEAARARAAELVTDMNNQLPAIPAMGEGLLEPTPSSPSASPGPRTPSRRMSTTKPDDTRDIKWAWPSAGPVPPAHQLRTPPRKVERTRWLRRVSSAISKSNKRSDSSSERANSHTPASTNIQHPSSTNQQSAKENPSSVRTKYAFSPSRPAPPPPPPACPLLPDFRGGLAYNLLINDDTYDRLPWCLAVRPLNNERVFNFATGGEIKEEPEGERWELDENAAIAFSNLLTGVVIRLGQLPHRRPAGPLPITNHYPRNTAIYVLVHEIGLPVEIAERIVDMALLLDDPAWLRRVREEKARNSHMCFSQSIGSLATPESTRQHQSLVAPPIRFVRYPHEDAFSTGSPPPLSTTPPRGLFRRKYKQLPITPPLPDLAAMERALGETATFVPVGRGEMEALIARQVCTDRRRYFTTYPAKCWPEYWYDLAPAP